MGGRQNKSPPVADEPPREFVWGKCHPLEEKKQSNNRSESEEEAQTILESNSMKALHEKLSKEFDKKLKQQQQTIVQLLSQLLATWTNEATTFTTTMLHQTIPLQPQQTAGSNEVVLQQWIDQLLKEKTEVKALLS